jgi:predicted nucleic acid-binding Zn ribbon protein
MIFFRSNRDADNRLSADQVRVLAWHRRRSTRTVQLVYGALALIMATVAAGLCQFADQLGIDTDTRDTAAFGFLLAACVETIGLFAWEHLFPAE